MSVRIFITSIDYLAQRAVKKTEKENAKILGKSYLFGFYLLYLARKTETPAKQSNKKGFSYWWKIYLFYVY